jgi:hypothetical protein
VPAAYVDSSALVKLVVAETETPALVAHLAGVDVVTSEVAGVEVPRASYLKTGDRRVLARAERLLESAYLVRLEPVRRAAARIAPGGLRSLDAIHLASALAVRSEIGELVAYDARLTSAALAAGLRVAAPGRT